MSRPVGFLFLVSLALGTAAVAAAESPVACRFTEAELVIDGRVDEPAWKHAQAIDGLLVVGGERHGSPPEQDTRVRLLWDRGALYVAAECAGSPHSDDAVALVLRPRGDHPQHYSIRVTADNVVEARLDGDEVASAAAPGRFWIESATERAATGGPPGWSLEVRIPWIAFFRTLGRPEIGGTWSFAIGRREPGDKEWSSTARFADTVPADGQAALHQLDALRPLVFAADPAPRPFGISRLPPAPVHNVRGSPDPPPPYVVEPAFPQAGLKNVIFVCPQPDSDRLLFISNTFGREPSRIRRIPDRADATAEDIETLLDDSQATRVNVVHYALTFHPRFAENGFVYVGCNGGARKDAATDAERSEPRKTRVLRYRIDPHPPWRLDPASETEIIAWESDGHNGGALAFGNDGMLYVTSGDGSTDSDAWQTGQDLTRLAAKVLRIDVDAPADGRGYSVPPDNPFVGLDNIRPETWAYGLRNPWRIDVDRATGGVWVGNNGQDLVEQIYEIARGANYGWSAQEGSRPFLPERKAGPSPISSPTCEHDHSEARSLTGGIVCRDVQHPDLEGEYVYGDHVTGRIWAVPHDDADAAVPRLLSDTKLMITSFARSHAGDVLVTDFFTGNSGGIYRLVPRPPQASVSEFPRRLSETGLFASVPRHELVPGAIPYGVNAAQWADGTHATRAIVLPQSMQMRTAERGWFTVPARMEVTGYQGWNLPDGVVVVQSLAAEARPGDPASRHWIETRLMLQHEGDWAGYTYRWTPDQQDAELVAAEGLDAELEIVAAGAKRMQRWRYPSRAECMVCHSAAANIVLGLSTVQLNRDFDYHAVLGGDATTDNQLRTLEHLGSVWQDMDSLARHQIETRVRDEVRAALPAPAADQRERYDAEVAKRVDSLLKECTSSSLRDSLPKPDKSTLLSAPSEAFPRLVNPHDATQDLALRVRSYLHTNCSSCHIGAGGGNSRIMFDFGTPLAGMQAIDQKPMHATFGIDDARIVAPGSPDRSVLLYRLAHRGPPQMPPLCSLAVDEAAVALVRQWIDSLPPSPQVPKP